MTRIPPPPQPSPRRPLLPFLLLAGLVALFLFPYLFLGRSMLPLELIPNAFQPWAPHAREIWGEIPRVHNPLLDSLQQYYPRRVYMGEALRGGWLPLWNPFVYGGSPFLATQQPAVLYPPAWPLSLIPPALQFGWSALLHLFLAASGTFLFLRRMGFRFAAAVAGAAAFTFNGFVVVWLAYPNVTQWTLCWLPLALYLWERGRAADDLRWIAGAALALALNILGGHGQSSEYVLLAWGAWALYRSVASGWRLRALGRWVVLPAALAVGLSLGHLLPCLEWLPRTDRGPRIAWDAAVHAGMPATQLWTFLIPRLFGDGTWPYLGDVGISTWMPAGGKAELAFIERSFYPGAAVLVLAAGAFALPRAEREQRGLAWFSLGLSLLALLMAMGTLVYWPFWRFVPGFSNFTAVARVLCLTAWGLACLAALGVQAVTDPEPAVRRRAAHAVTAAGALGVLLALAAYMLYPAPREVDDTLARLGRPTADGLLSRDLGLALAWLLAPSLLAWLTLPVTARGRALLQPGHAGTLAGLIVAADLFAFGTPYNPKADPKYLGARTPELAAVTQQMQALAAQGDLPRLLSAGPPGQEDVLKLRMPSNLPSTYGYADVSGSDSFVTRRYREWEASLRGTGESPWRRPGAPNLRSAGVRFYLTGSEQPFEGLRSVVGTRVQEDPRALPYARLHTFAQALPEQAVRESLDQPNRSERVALLSGPGAPSFEGPARVIPFRARRVNGNRVVLEGTSPLPGLLVVCEQFDPGWKVRIDGRPGALYPAEHLLCGIPLPAGAHRVELSYTPQSFRVGVFVSLAALACLCGLLVAPRARAGQAR